jgi:putative acetyltransferase
MPPHDAFGNEWALLKFAKRRPVPMVRKPTPSMCIAASSTLTLNSPDLKNAMLPRADSPVIRLATVADVPQLARLYYETVIHNGGQHYTEAQTQAWASFAHDQTAFAQFVTAATTFLLEADGDILGFAGLAQDGHVTAIYVRSDRLGQGIGSQLLQTLLQSAARQGIQRLYAEASEFSMGLFLKFGFQQFDTEVVDRNGVQFQRYLVEKTLD